MMRMKKRSKMAVKRVRVKRLMQQQSHLKAHRLKKKTKKTILSHWTSQC